MMTDHDTRSQGYLEFSNIVRQARLAVSSGVTCGNDIHSLLNGGAGAALRSLIDKKTRADFGMFFSGEGLAKKVAALAAPHVTPTSVIADPACGAGDLLLPFLAGAPLGADLSSTMRLWMERILGLDLHPHLAHAAKERIALLAAYRHGSDHTRFETLPTLDLDAYTNVRAGDYLKAGAATAEADVVVMNPPFIDADAPDGCTWSTGKVQQAAVFVLHALAQAKIGQKLIAILPDVLRSGTRYERWRREVSALATVESVEIFGRFDRHTDVDVFIVKMERCSRQTSAIQLTAPNCEGVRIGDLFKVSVGAVVPHRHPKRGPWAYYLDVSGAPADEEITLRRRRRFSGTLHQGPFVVLRRTSSPSDARRLVPSILASEETVAVENHLLVLQPYSKSIAACRDLVARLPALEPVVNLQIRCRHLTTKVVGDLRLGA
jgi:hypothetical protein